MTSIPSDKIRWRLRQVHNGTIFDINLTCNFMVGRNAQAQICLNSNKTSRTHSSFIINLDGHLMIQDLKSFNGTFVNGTQIPELVLHRVYPGDTIGFGISTMNLAENVRDMQTFFVVQHDDEPSIQELPPTPDEVYLVDSTTGSQDGADDNSINSNLSTGRNTTADIKNKSDDDLLQLPSTSGLTFNEHVDVIEIKSSIADEEGPNIKDIDDYFKENSVSKLKIIEVHSVPMPAPEEKKVVSSNWSEKPFTRKTKNKSLEKVVGSEKRNCVSLQKVTDFFDSHNKNRRHTISDVVDVHLSKKDADMAMTSTTKSEKKKLEGKKKSIEYPNKNDSVEFIKNKNIQSKNENLEQKIAGDNLNNLKNKLDAGDQKSVKTKSNLVPKRRKSFIVPDSEIRNEESSNKNSNDSSGSNSSAGNSYIQNDVLQKETRKKQEKEEYAKEKCNTLKLEDLKGFKNKDKSTEMMSTMSEKTTDVDGHNKKDDAKQKENSVTGQQHKQVTETNTRKQIDFNPVRKVSSRRKTVESLVAPKSSGDKEKEYKSRRSISNNCDLKSKSGKSHNEIKEHVPKKNANNDDKFKNPSTSKKNNLSSESDLLVNNELQKKIVQPKSSLTDMDIKSIKEKKALDDIKKQSNKKKKRLTILSNQEKVKIDDFNEFNFSCQFGSEKKDNPTKNLAEHFENNSNTNTSSSSKGKDLQCHCPNLSVSNHQIECPYYKMNSSNKDINTKNPSVNFDNDVNIIEPKHSNLSFKSGKLGEKSFTVNEDNSVIIDITDEDDDMDVSNSQIFHMSQIVKSEVPDDYFQKIKNELAEMDFCNEEIVINPVPINLDDDCDMSGFENTQDICDYLEDGIEENQNNDNLISNEENEELLKTLEEVDKTHDNLDITHDVEDMEVAFYSASSVSSKNKDYHAAIKEDQPHKTIDCINIHEKSKFKKPPVIEAHTIIKPKKDPSKKSPLKQENKERAAASKRKHSIETPDRKKKLKSSPHGIAEPPRCDSKSIQLEFKKRHSGSIIEQDSDKSFRDTIRDERRKKLKEMTERCSNTKITETKTEKVKTVKVLPNSKTSRGGFLCEELPSPTLTRPKTPNKDSPRTSLRPKTPNKNLSKQSPKPPTADNNISKPLRSKTPDPSLVEYQLKPLDLLEQPTQLSRYNLRRTKSSGDIKEDVAKLINPLNYVQSRYNLRHSTASIDSNTQNNLPSNQLQSTEKPILMPNSNVDPRIRRRAITPNPTLNLPYADTRVPNLPPQAYPQVNITGQRFPHNSVSRVTQDSSRRLMWTNGGRGNVRSAPVRRLPDTDDVVTKMVHWLPNWLLEQVDNDSSAPVNKPPATKIPLNFQNFEQYYDTFSKLVLLENWQYLYKGFRDAVESPRKVKIEHLRVVNQLMIMDCVCYISLQELKQGLFYKPDDFVLIEYVINDKDKKQNSYMSLNFGMIQRCKKTPISNTDVISVRLAQFSKGEHTKLEFSVLTRYQPEREVNMKKFPIVKVLANVRNHLMLIRAIKGLVDSPLCSKVLYPKINEYRFRMTHPDIIQPHSLNTQQRTIVLEAASLCTGTSNGIYCIKGPPGTGKSTVIVNLVFQILFSHYVTKKTKEPPMILLAAPSNTAVDNLLSKLTAEKHKLGSEWDKFKHQIKCVRIGPESSISKDLLGYSLPKLAEKHVPVKNMELPEFKAARERNENLHEFSRTYFGDRYAHEVKMCADLIIEKSNIICTTLSSCTNGKLMEAVNRGLVKFTCCIIDEATQCHEIEALLPTVLGIDKLVLVGDPKQLNATIMNRDALKLRFGESLFSRIANNLSNDPRSPIKMLTDQYRMHPEICAFPNKQFYEGKLRSFPKPSNRLPDKIRPYLVFNCAKISESAEYTNIDEVNLIKKLLSTIFDMIDRNQKYTVGIITPYNAQKDLINQNIKSLVSTNEKNCKIAVNTVDSFQGSENDIIIISCVRDSTNSFLQNPNRLNVALTRAKQALYIVGNYTLFKECRPLYDLREDAKKRRLLLDIRQNPLNIENFSKYLIKRRESRD